MLGVGRVVGRAVAEGGGEGEREEEGGVARKGRPFFSFLFFLVPVGDVSLVKAVRRCPFMGAYGAAPCGRARARGGRLRRPGREAADFLEFRRLRTVNQGCLGGVSGVFSAPRRRTRASFSAYSAKAGVP